MPRRHGRPLDPRIRSAERRAVKELTMRACRDRHDPVQRWGLVMAPRQPARLGLSDPERAEVVEALRSARKAAILTCTKCKIGNPVYLAADDLLAPLGRLADALTGKPGTLLDPLHRYGEK